MTIAASIEQQNIALSGLDEVTYEFVMLPVTVFVQIVFMLERIARAAEVILTIPIIAVRRSMNDPGYLIDFVSGFWCAGVFIWTLLRKTNVPELTNEMIELMPLRAWNILSCAVASLGMLSTASGNAAIRVIFLSFSFGFWLLWASVGIFGEIMPSHLGAIGLSIACAIAVSTAKRGQNGAEGKSGPTA